MITYGKFKELFEKLESNRGAEIEFYFNNRESSYMLIKYNGYISFQKCGISEEQSGEMIFNNLDELYNTKTIDGLVLKDEWKNINDIIVDAAWSVVGDRKELKNQYNVEL